MKRLLLSSLVALVAIPTGAQNYTQWADSADNYIKRSRWADAKRCFTNAMRLEPANPGNSLLLSNMGIVSTELGDYEQALLYYEAALSRLKRSSAVHENRARTYLRMGEHEQEALDDINAALAIDSTLTWPLNMRGLLMLSRNDTVSAKRDFQRLLELQPDSVAPYYGLGTVAYREARFERADSLYSKALSISPRDEEVLFWRAASRLNLNKLNEADDDVSDGLKLNPRNGDFYLIRALLNQMRYRPTDAEIDLKNAREFGADTRMIQAILPKKRR